MGRWAARVRGPGCRTVRQGGQAGICPERGQIRGSGRGRIVVFVAGTTGNSRQETLLCTAHSKQIKPDNSFFWHFSPKNVTTNSHRMWNSWARQAPYWSPPDTAPANKVGFGNTNKLPDDLKMWYCGTHWCPRQSPLCIPLWGTRTEHIVLSTNPTLKWVFLIPNWSIMGRSYFDLFYFLNHF